ncbi:MAG: UDP-forming cellulose synthase catalytic subunit [Methylophilaceae bacterium]|nr:UDP-forming cellulose synthase catalytic subunit [Methylophilaceae bacterium]
MLTSRPLESWGGPSYRRVLALVRAIVPAFCAISLIYLVNLSIEQFDLQRQLLFSWSILIILIATFKWQLIKRPLWRFVFILLNGLIALNYLIWRSTESLIYTGPLDFLAMALLFLAELYALTVHFLGMFVNFWPMRNRPAPPPTDTTAYPSVDVLIPTYNEDEDIIRITAIAATQMDYPKEKLRVYICDDGGTVEKRTQQDSRAAAAAWERHYRLRRMAKELGVGYITRETNRSAKAGNLNHALRHTDGELVLILDCDHVPTRDLLSRTVGYFLLNPKLFLVQTPHFFINPTPIEKNVVDIGNPNAENDMFYREIHRSMDFWNSSFFCGSAAVLRRKHLMEVGGIQGKTITEDAETALKLHAKGYDSAYVDRPMVCGLSPENYSDYMVQRTRWAQGMTQLFMMSNPLLSKGLRWHQRLCYFNACFHWFFGFARLMFYIAPALFLLFGLKIYHASISQILIYSLPYVISTFVLIDFFYGRTREPFFSELYESVQAMFLIPAVVSAIFYPHKPTFKVTPKRQTLTDESLHPWSVIFLVAILINVISIVAGIYKWFTYPLLRDTLLVTGVWCLYNLFLLMISLGAFWERKQIRYYHRVKTQEKAIVTIPRLHMEVEAEVVDISLTGMAIRFRSPCSPNRGEQVVIQVSDGWGHRYEFDAILLRIARHGQQYACGVELVLDAAQYANAVRFVYGDSNRWLGKWGASSKSRNTLKMLLVFFMQGLRAITLSMNMLLKKGGNMLWDLIQHAGFNLIKTLGTRSR